VSGQRAKPVVTADHRSVHPSIPGVPWWGAVLIAVTATVIGFAFDAASGDRELTAVFAAFYVLGCVMAVLAVRQSGLFTSVVQPPLILFVSVPLAYFLFHGATYTGAKDTLINCVYPLIERFPLMFFASAGALLIGMARWYYAMSAAQRAPKTDEDSTGRFGPIMSKITSMFTREPTENDVDATKPPRRRHSIDRPAMATRTPTKTRRPARRGEPTRSRHLRPPETEIMEPVGERPRRRRATRGVEPPPVPPSEPRRRRARTSSKREPRKQPPPVDRRARPERHPDGYEPLERHGNIGANSTHHPISRVRYRDADDDQTRATRRTYDA
jgi:hypothetical protein